MEIKSFHHVCIQTSKYRESFDFYVDLLGCKLVKESKGFHSRDFNTWLKLGNILIELQTPKKGTEFKEWSNCNSGPVHIAVVVSNVREAYDFIKGKGYTRFKIKNGKEYYEVNGSPLFKVKAPEGTEIEVRENTEIT